MTIKFFKPNDPKISDDSVQSWLYDTMHVVAIEEMVDSPSAYFIMEVKPELRHRFNDATLSMIVKQPHLNRTYFANYDLANAVINKVKDANYGK